MRRPQALSTFVALILGLGALILALAMTLSRTPEIVAGSNRIEAAGERFRIISGRFEGCQGNEVVPRHTTAIRLSLHAVLGPQIRVRVLQDKRRVSYGERGAGWTSGDVTVPIKLVNHTINGALICYEFTPKDESVDLIGQAPAANQTSGAASVLLRIEYLKAGTRSWWSQIRSITSNMAPGRAWTGKWIALFLAAIMATILAVVCQLALRPPR